MSELLLHLLLAGRCQPDESSLPSSSRENQMMIAFGCYFCFWTKFLFLSTGCSPFLTSHESKLGNNKASYLSTNNLSSLPIALFLLIALLWGRSPRCGHCPPLLLLVVTKKINATFFLNDITRMARLPRPFSTGRRGEWERSERSSTNSTWYLAKGRRRIQQWKNGPITAKTAKTDSVNSA